MSGIKGKSGRKPDGQIKLRIRIVLDPSRDADLAQFFAALPAYGRGDALKAALRGGLRQGQSILAAQLTRAAALAAQERAEIDAGLAGLGSTFDE